MYVDRTDRPEPKKIISLFDHEKFIMSLKRESDVLNLTPKEILENDANDIIDYWLKRGLRKPQAHKMQSAKVEFRKQLIQVMTGRHTNMKQKLSKQQIMTSVTHFSIARFNPDFLPTNKNSVKLSLSEFIYKDRPESAKPGKRVRETIKSHLLFYLDPPLPMIKEINPELTKEIKRQFIIAKWGHDIGESEILSITEQPAFVRASNRIIKYLKEVEKYLEPLMGLSSKKPARAAYALVKANNVTRSEFVSYWLANDFSFINMDNWLKSQGFFRPTYRAV